MPPAPVIVVRGVTKSFASTTSARPRRSAAGAGPVQALADVTVTIGDHEFVSILGPSGCGKSTLIRIVAGLTGYDSGEVTVNGAPMVGPVPEVGVVFQTSNLLPWLTVQDNLMLGARLRRVSATETAARLAALLPSLGLGGFEQRYPHELSGGMRQRVALGQALALDPAVLLMDEPFAALDALTRDRLNVELLRLWQARRQTALLVTHSILEAVFLSDRVLVMSPRPGTIAHERVIDLPRPRDPEHTRRDPQFQEHVNELAKLMGVF